MHNSLCVLGALIVKDYTESYTQRTERRTSYLHKNNNRKNSEGQGLGAVKAEKTPMKYSKLNVHTLYCF